MLDGVVDYLPSPLDMPPVKGINPKNGAEEIREAKDDAPFAALAFKLQTDPYVGSAGVSGAFGNLCRRLLVDPIVNKAGNARAKGQVENAHNIVETDFESGFKFTHVPR